MTIKRKLWSDRTGRYIGVTAASVVLVLDQLSKWLILKFQAGRPPTDIIPGSFRLIYTTNPGAAWGLFSDHTALLGMVSLLVMIFIIVRFRAMSEGLPERVLALGILIGGVGGNLIDRFFRGAVIDFIDVYYRSWHWPAFNLADTAICVGITVFLISSAVRQESATEEKPES